VTAFRIRPVTRKEARVVVAKWHSHHKAHVGELFALGGYVGHECVAVVVMGRPVAPSLDDGETWEVTRLCVGPDAPRFAASRLLGAAGRVMDASGVQLGISYTRVDEPGTCYRASNWTPVGWVKGDSHTHGNRALRWLPGLYEPSSEVIDRVRWERGPRAGSCGVTWDGARWSRSEAA
jgi:hypothetical protein